MLFTMQYRLSSYKDDGLLEMQFVVKLVRNDGLKSFYVY